MPAPYGIASFILQSAELTHHDIHLARIFWIGQFMHVGVGKAGRFQIAHDHIGRRFGAFVMHRMHRDEIAEQVMRQGPVLGGRHWARWRHLRQGGGQREARGDDETEGWIAHDDFAEGSPFDKLRVRRIKLPHEHS